MIFISTYYILCLLHKNSPVVLLVSSMHYTDTHPLIVTALFLDYQAIEAELDKIDSCLSVIEGWNENLHLECVKLLERTREMRQQAANPATVENE